MKSDVCCVVPLRVAFDVELCVCDETALAALYFSIIRLQLLLLTKKIHMIMFEE